MRNWTAKAYGKAWPAVLIAVSLATPAAAQLGARLPDLPGLGGVQTPAVGSLANGAVQGVDETVAGATRLADLRRLQVRQLIRANPRLIDVDAAGAPVVRGQILAAAATAEALGAARAAGFQVAGQSRLEALDLTYVILAAPPGLTTRKAVERLRALDPGGSYEFNHIYTGSGVVAAAAGADARAAAPPAGPPARLGLVDTGVAAAHPAFARARLDQRGFAPGGFKAGAHGTAVASLMIGQDRAFHGAAPGEALRVADVFGSGPTGGSAEAIVRALAWMAETRTTVVNISLVGPPNALLAAAVRALQARGAVVVAAVGNDGPAAPPLYPAAWPGVISVTAVDGRRKVLAEAGRAGHVDFAAPGVGPAAAIPGAGYVAVRGTSFAAPVVAALLARAGGGAGAVEALGAQAVDLGAPGPDPVYGRGLVGAAK